MHISATMSDFNNSYIAPFAVVKKTYPGFSTTEHYGFTLYLDIVFTRPGQKSTNIIATISFDASGLKVTSNHKDISLNDRLFYFTEDAEKITLYIGNIGYSASAKIKAECNDKSVYFFDSAYGNYTATKAAVTYVGRATLHYAGTQSGTYFYIKPSYPFGTIEIMQNRSGGVANWRTGRIFYDGTNVVVSELVPGSALITAIYENGQIRVNTYDGSPLTYIEY